MHPERFRSTVGEEMQANTASADGSQTGTEYLRNMDMNHKQRY